MALEQRLEAKGKEVLMLREEIDQLKEDLLGYRLNLVKKGNSSIGELETELVAMNRENKQLKIEVNQLRHKIEDLTFK